MIGSTGRNTGKTQLACSILNKFAKSHQIIGVKVTTVTAHDGRCPRGGKGCGVCSSLEGNFAITEETDTHSGKDTSRLLTAGAGRVLWLRVLKTHLQEGFTALLKEVGADALLICESNSLRTVVEPALFLMTEPDSSTIWKISAVGIRQYVDNVVVSDGKAFDFDINRIDIINGKWTLREKAAAIVMAGGQSRRMETDKSMLHINGRSMIEAICQQLVGNFEQILISDKEESALAFLGFSVIKDKISGQGPLMGIVSALESSTNQLNFVTACDIPYIDLKFVRRMLREAEGFDAVIPIRDDGKIEPLFAIYRKSVVPAINNVLSAGGRKIRDFFDQCKVKYIPLDAENFANLNTITEYKKFKEIGSDCI
ncbi:MAG: NTP transferase domain-containing protein [Sedimentisphaerales bacterium]|nr:NTP transferase domain-containing protein [Sedimentisphaerales bacterium]